MKAKAAEERFKAQVALRAVAKEEEERNECIERASQDQTILKERMHAMAKRASQLNKSYSGEEQARVEAEKAAARAEERARVEAERAAVAEERARVEEAERAAVSEERVRVEEAERAASAEAQARESKKISGGAHDSLMVVCRFRLSILGLFLVLIGVTLNLQWMLFGRSLVECLSGSKSMISLGNRAWRSHVRSSMKREGLLAGIRTECYGPSASSCDGDVYVPGVFCWEMETPRVDIYEPPRIIAHDSTSPLRPAALYFHAGAWVMGFREMGAGTLKFLAAHGVVGISVSYGLTSGSASDGGIAVAIDDAWQALQWTRDNAGRLRIDPERIFVIGDSSGGLLALSLATGVRYPNNNTPLPAAVVAGWPAVTLDARSWQPIRKTDLPSITLCQGNCSGSSTIGKVEYFWVSLSTAVYPESHGLI